MLLLTRRIGESIMITFGAETAKVTLLEMRGNQARLGIQAPATVIVDREEIASRRRKNRNEDSQIKPC